MTVTILGDKPSRTQTHLIEKSWQVAEFRKLVGLEWAERTSSMKKVNCALTLVITDAIRHVQFNR